MVGQIKVRCCVDMYLYESIGVAVLEVDSHPEQNKRPPTNPLIARSLFVSSNFAC